ncbi:MAG: M20 family metallopeptidase [Nitrospinota bacterium]|nr:M20 family metallopeptidase [Nitrospinota bacterium]
MMPDQKRIRKELEKLRPEILRINKLIFDNPELNFNELFASELLAEEMEKHGFRVKRGKGKLKTAFEAVFTGKSAKPSIALLAEYDALPGIGHACGHNMIAASSFGAAVVAKNILGDRCGKLSLMGTPAEEGGGGKIQMIADGWFKGIDAAMMVHPSNKNRVVARMLAVAEMEFHFYGKASHAAANPELGINALDGVITLFNSVNALRQQTPNFSRLHGIVMHGGDAPNIIPEYASAKFMARGITMRDYEYVKKRLIECAKGAASSTGCKLKIKNNPMAFHAFEPNRTLGKIFSAHMANVGLTDYGFNETEQIGSSDIGNLSQTLPALHPEFAVGDSKTVNHSRDFLKAVLSKNGVENMMKMTEALAATTIELFMNPSLVAEAKKEFNAFKANRS